MIDESIHVSHIYLILQLFTQHHLKPDLRFFFDQYSYTEIAEESYL